MKLGRLGVWYGTDKLDGPQLRDFVRTVENNGYSTLWYPESRGYESMSLAAWLLSSSHSGVRSPTSMPAIPSLRSAPWSR
jgi:alkanesulfonate monooxygenase SsuD/methylene tetrahydromethanopterin reductase-like flavin-dependent oxidoreductase (luciferase family)